MRHVLFPNGESERLKFFKKCKSKGHSFAEFKLKVTSFLEFNDWSIAQNFKVFSSCVARAVGGYGQNQCRPQFNIRSTGRPAHKVALLVAHPVNKFMAACREDKITPIKALDILNSGKFPSFHFFPQSRYLANHARPVFAWRAPDDVPDFWKDLGLGEAPEIYRNSSQMYERELYQVYLNDFILWDAVVASKTLIPTSLIANLSFGKLCVLNKDFSTF